MEDQGPQIIIYYGRRQSFGRIGHASRVIHVLGRVRASEGVHVLSFVLNRSGPRVPVPVGPTAFRLTDPGEFNIEIDRGHLQPGENTLTLIAIDRKGRQAQGDVVIDYTPNTAWPLPCKTEWSTVQNPQAISEAVDGVWHIDNGGLRTMRTGYEKLVAIGDASWTDYEVTVPFTVHRIDTEPTVYRWPSMGPLVGVKLCSQAHADWGDLLPPRGWFPLGAYGHLKHQQGMGPGHVKRMIRGNGYVPPLAQEEEPWPLKIDHTYVFRVSVQQRPGATAVYRMKAWSQDESEPADWDLTGEGVQGESPGGALQLMAHHMDVTFGDVVVEPCT